MDQVVLKREYGKDIGFFGGIDENVILATGAEKEVRDEVERIIDILGDDGRYIVAASHDYLLPEIPVVNIVAMFDEARNIYHERIIKGCNILLPQQRKRSRIKPG